MFGGGGVGCSAPPPPPWPAVSLHLALFITRPAASDRKGSGCRGIRVPVSGLLQRDYHVATIHYKLHLFNVLFLSVYQKTVFRIVEESLRSRLLRSWISESSLFKKLKEGRKKRSPSNNFKVPHSLEILISHPRLQRSSSASLIIAKTQLNNLQYVVHLKPFMIS